MLAEMGKSFIDVNGIEAYEKSKEDTQKRIKERHHRHQVKRRRQKGDHPHEEENNCQEQKEGCWRYFLAVSKSSSIIYFNIISIYCSFIVANNSTF